jgi:hypothetical protein
LCPSCCFDLPAIASVPGAAGAPAVAEPLLQKLTAAVLASLLLVPLLLLKSLLQKLTAAVLASLLLVPLLLLKSLLQKLTAAVLASLLLLKTSLIDSDPMLLVSLLLLKSLLLKMPAVVRHSCHRWGFLLMLVFQRC